MELSERVNSNEEQEQEIIEEKENPRIRSHSKEETSDSESENQSDSESESESEDDADVEERVVTGFGLKYDKEELLLAIDKIVRKPKYLLFSRNKRKSEEISNSTESTVKSISNSPKKRLNLVPDLPNDQEGWEKIDIFNSPEEANDVIQGPQNENEESKIVPVSNLEERVDSLEEARSKEQENEGKRFDSILWIKTVLEESGHSTLFEEIFEFQDCIYFLSKVQYLEYGETLQIEPSEMVKYVSNQELYNLKSIINSNCSGPHFVIIN